MGSKWPEERQLQTAFNASRVEEQPTKAGHEKHLVTYKAGKGRREALGPGKERRITIFETRPSG